MYTLENLLQDVAHKRSRVGGEGGNLDYREAWNAYMRYISSCLEQRRGLYLSSLCKIGWSVEKKRQGQPTYRPLFQLADQFCRSYASADALRKNNAPSSRGEPAPFEDFNFSKAAIKHSNQLSKDQVFSSLRAIVQQLGEACSEGKDLDIDFTGVGRLVCRGDRDPRFNFSMELQSGPDGTGGGAGADSRQGQRLATPAIRKEAPKAARDMGVRGNNVASTQDMRGGAGQQDYQATMGGRDYGASFSGLETVQEEPERPISSHSRRSLMSSHSRSAPNLSNIGDTRSNTLTAQQFKREVAYKEAMDRHIGEMEARAQEAMSEKEAWSSHVSACLDQERDDIVQRRMRAMENKHFLQQQKRLNAERRKEQRHEDIVAASAHEFPKFQEPAETEMKSFTQGQQARMRQDLDDQVRTNATLRNLAKQRERALEINQLEANRSEMALLRDAERSKKAYDREALATAWNAEIRMKNIWKAIDNHNKVASNADVLSFDVPPSRGGSVASAGRLLTGNSRRVPMGASMSLEKLQGRMS